MSKETRVPIVHADECTPCPCCGEPFCELHQMHYAECSCIGPHNAEEEGYEVISLNGKLFGVKREDVDKSNEDISA